LLAIKVSWGRDYEQLFFAWSDEDLLHERDGNPSRTRRMAPY
jgi:hypothetical protein